MGAACTAGDEGDKGASVSCCLRGRTGDISQPDLIIRALRSLYKSRMCLCHYWIISGWHATMDQSVYVWGLRR